MGIGLAWSRCAKAWSALAGRLDGGSVESLESAAAQGVGAERATTPAQAKATARTWMADANLWRDERAKKAAMSSHGEGVALMARLASMDPLARSELARMQAEEIFPLAQSLLDAATRACEAPSSVWAAQECELHALYCEARGEPLDRRALQESAGRAARAPWWEVAAAWGERLSALACRQAREGAWSLSDEDWCSMAESASSVAQRAGLSAAAPGEGRPERRARESWALCCSWPWPEEPVAAETREWARRKWSEARMVGDGGGEPVFADLPERASWADLAMAKVRMDDPVYVGLGGAEAALPRLLEAFAVARERRALGAQIPPGSDAAPPARSKSL